MRSALLTISLAATSALFAEVIHCVPGQLGGRLAGMAGEASAPVDLKLTGEAYPSDLYLLGECGKAFGMLDMSALKLVECTLMRPDAYGCTHYPADQLPEGVFLSLDAGQIELPSGLRVISDGAFADVRSLKNIVAPASLSRIGRNAFSGAKSLETVDLSCCKNVQIGDEAFCGCTSLSRFIPPAEGYYVGSLSFAGTAIESVDMPLKAEKFAFASMPELDSVSGAILSEEGLFADCRNLTTVALPDSVAPAFLASTGIEHMTFPEGLTSVGSEAFAGCLSLAQIDASALMSPPDVADDSFSGVRCGSVALYVMEDAMPAWQSAPVWGEFDIRKNTNVSLTETGLNGFCIQKSDAGMLRISAPSEIISVSIYGLGGLPMNLSVKKEGDSAVVCCGDMSEGVKIIIVNTAAGEAVFKVIL